MQIFFYSLYLITEILLKNKFYFSHPCEAAVTIETAMLYMHYDQKLLRIKNAKTIRIINNKKLSENTELI